MTLDELIHRLTELRDEEAVDGDTTVLFAHQPNYPLQCGIVGPTVVSEDQDEIEELELGIQRGEYTDDDLIAAREELARMRAEQVTVVYLAEGSSSPWIGDKELSPYAPNAAWGS